MVDRSTIEIYWPTQERFISVDSEVAENMGIIENQTLDDEQVQALYRGVLFLNQCLVPDEAPEWWRDLMNQEAKDKEYQPFYYNGKNGNEILRVGLCNDGQGCNSCRDWAWKDEQSINNYITKLFATENNSWDNEIIYSIHCLKWRNNVFVESNILQEGKA